jgi:hypothetical protein
MRLRAWAIATVLASTACGVGKAMPFSIFEDDPRAWGCPNLILMFSSPKHGAELLIPKRSVQETARVPWRDHLASPVHIRWKNDEGDVSHPVPLFVSNLKEFHVAGADRRKQVHMALRALRAEARRDDKHYWQFVLVVENPTSFRRRLIWRRPFEFSDRNSAPNQIERDIVSLFQEGRRWRSGQNVHVIVLSADEKEGAPPNLDELGYVQSIYDYALSLVEADAHPESGRHLVNLVKLSSSAGVPELLFLYDAWEDDPKAWVFTN